MRPGPRLVPVLAALAAASLAVPLVPELGRVLAVLAAATLLSALTEAALLSRLKVSLERRGLVALDLDEEEEVGTTLWTSARRPVSLVIRQRWPALVAEGSSSARGVCLPGRAMEVSFRVRGIARGNEILEPAAVAATSWGLAERVLAAGSPGALAVLPNLRAVGRLHRQLNQIALRGLGNRTAPRRGKGQEFDRLREYQEGDDFRDIAWKATARHKKLIVQEYRIDRAQEILVCTDRGHRMAARAGRIARIDHAANAAVVFAYLANRIEDRMGLLSFAATVEPGVLPGRGAGHLRRVMSFATALSAEYVHTDYLALAVDLGRRLRHRTLVLVLTDLPLDEERAGELVRLARSLAAKHVAVFVVSSDPALEARARFLPADRAELARTLVARDLWWNREQVLRELRRLGAMVVETPPDRWGIEAINAYLEIKRRQVL
ncbi:MAG: DUF58 domain-containing protein [Planctomycetes bacterium]|nr:DUF58 domain-containing protein [Planctomycetota bacterium]